MKISAYYSMLILCLSIFLSADINAMQQQSSDAIERITVTGQRSEHHYKRQLELAQMDFIESYNALNTISNFSIDCHPRANIGSHIKKMECLPRYFNRELGYQAQAFMQGASSRNNSNAEYVSFITQNKKLKFEKHIAKLSQESAELQRKLEKVGQAKLAYEQRAQQK